MKDLLDSIKDPSELKYYSRERLAALESELRTRIIERVSQNGGHLASNLGVIELTIALFRVFDFTKDRIVFDVGHQSYAYKILTGRLDAFRTLRQWGGMAGFPRTDESRYDFFNTGHSSTSISAALGMARALKAEGKDGHVIALIGDGAMTGGMAFEALNDAGQSGENLIVILNDNQMSIAKNVGGLSVHLNTLRTSKGYLRLKGRTERGLRKVPVIGRRLTEEIARLKSAVRRRFVANSNALFENFGFRYYGPFDGHDTERIERGLEAAKKVDGPVLLHVCTVKGQGYTPAEHQPQNYHGVAPFEIESGVPEVMLPDLTQDATASFTHAIRQAANFTDCFSKSLQYYAVRDERLVGVCAAMSGGTGMDAFGELFPERFFDVGIAEQHAVTMAAGMAREGLHPVVALYATFLQRALDQVQHDVVLQKLPVVFCVDRAGVVGEDGETHQGLYDLAYLLALPYGRVLAPRSYDELFLMMGFALRQIEGPTFIRYPKGTALLGREDNREFLNLHGGDAEHKSSELGAQWLRRGRDLNLIGWGYTTGLLWQAAKRLLEEGIDCGVLDLRSLKPLDQEKIDEAALLPLFICEEIVHHGSAGQDIISGLIQRQLCPRVKLLCLPDEAILHGKRSVVLEAYGLGLDNVIAEIKNLMAEDQGT